MDLSDDEQRAAPGRTDESGRGAPADPVIGHTVSHYRVQEKLGGGGMGVVYMAEDLKLGRTVALKFLPFDLSRDEAAKARFVAEARAASALDHPNICTVHEIGEANDGRLFIAMACYEGETLQQKIDRGPLPVKEALGYTLRMAEGLHAAHEAGIVHRDLKPANVMVTDRGRVKILDFGLAKVADVSLTQTGVRLGTAAYMSPEQARGETVDHRTDIWSLGAVLYELLTGERPFRGDYAEAVVYAILNEEIKPVTQRREGLPPALDRIVQKTLAKRPEDRYGDLDAVMADLQVLATPHAVHAGSLPIRSRLARRPKTYVYGTLAGFVAVALGVFLTLFPQRAGGIESLAVLPFDNLSRDSDQEYFVAGMHDALIGELAQISALRVISRTSAVRYRGSNKSVPEIARELNVDGIVEASVFRTGDSVRIQVQLIQASPEERHLWARSFDSDMRNVLALHSDVAQAVAREIQVVVTPQEEALLAASRPVDPEAHEAYLRGIFHLTQLTPEGIERGLEYLHQAVEIDPRHPLSHAGLAHGYSLIASHSPNPPPDAFDQAMAAAHRALDLDETLAEAHGALAEIRLYREWDWRGAEQAFRRALELKPSLAATRVHFAWFLHLFRRSDEALAELQRAIHTDPLTPIYRVWLSEMYWSIGLYDAALEEAHAALELAPELPWAYDALGRAYTEKGMFGEATAAHQKAVAMNPRWKWALARTYAMAGREPEARTIANELEQQGNPMQAWGLVILYTALDEIDKAMRWVEVAYENRHPWTPWFSSHMFEPLHTEPRFQEIMRQMNLPFPAGSAVRS